RRSSDLSNSMKTIKNKSTRSQYVRDDFSSRESMPCPSPTRSVTNTLIRTPNKPIITKSTYNEFSSAHIICAFNSTIHIVKSTIGEQMYEKVISMLQMGNKLAIDDSIVNKLNNIFSNIFQSSYSE